MPKTVVKKFSCSELKIKKINFFYSEFNQNFFCSSVFNVGGCLASCLTFRSILTLDPYKKTCTALLKNRLQDIIRPNVYLTDV